MGALRSAKSELTQRAHDVPPSLRSQQTRRRPLPGLAAQPTAETNGSIGTTYGLPAMTTLESAEATPIADVAIIKGAVKVGRRCRQHGSGPGVSQAR